MRCAEHQEVSDDEAVRSLCRKARIEKLKDDAGEATPWVSVVELTLKDGRRLERRADSSGPWRRFG